MRAEQRPPGPHAAFAARLLSARRRAGFSHDTLAEKAKTSRQHLIQLEKGRHMPKPPMLAALAAALDVTVEWLVVDETDSAASEADEEAARMRSLTIDELLRLRIQEIVSEQLARSVTS